MYSAFAIDPMHVDASLVPQLNPQAVAQYLDNQDHEQLAAIDPDRLADLKALVERTR
jgi:hypothetical protein